ncbi:MAG TPA: 4-(cytidine 5'-diphospho)-2-C-methyl-D-erythritol kinase [Thermoanaerobaculaceae bacterium]|nr:4-(cytidine 5'-diphospho)-2-C-methyl-D-erythritol kinase [Thermoanaerobaculaceae bacterium]HRS17531.1 4-(cytidine 5'-diphospho)-2-C-methyl-D-erythritol kinase [Thermoanaerobaculaceae bacterium]
MKVQVWCPAKINLHLEVLGRRGDGYHELRTLFASVGVWDELEFVAAPAGERTLDVEPAGAVPADDSNLVLRTARALAEAWPGAGGVRIRLRKRIPVAGGMGGGSADAAAALVGLAALWRLPARPADLRRIGAQLGADVPFFLVGGVAWGVGRGSEVYPLADLPPWWVVLVPGRESVPTAEVYRALPARALDGRLDSEVYEWVVSGGELPIGACRNDLQPTVLERWPAIAGRLERVERTGPRLAMVSGSGGTVYGLFGDEGSARHAAVALADLGPVVAPVLQRDLARLQPSVGED